MPISKKTQITIGYVLKTARMKRNLTADEVAALCNVSRSRYYQWEAQTFVFPKNLRALSAALHVPVKRLEAVNRQQH